MIPANDSVTLRIRFRSEELGQFDQTLNFEIMGTRRRYQLFCRGVCSFPTISREPRVVFPHRRKYRKPEEIVHKKYVLSNETFEFGPLLCGMSKLLELLIVLFLRTLICIEQALALFEAVLNVRVSFKNRIAPGRGWGGGGGALKSGMVIKRA